MITIRNKVVFKNKPKIFHLGLCVNTPPLNGLQTAFIRNSSEYQELSVGVLNVNENAIQMVRSFKPDIIFMQIQQEGVIREETVLEFKKNGAFVVNFTGDVRFPIPDWYYKLGRHIDFTLFSNMTDVEKMNEDKVPSRYLEIGIDPLIYTNTGSLSPSRNIVFFGNNYGEHKFPMSQYRIQMVQFLKEKFGDNFGVFGNGWSRADGNLNHSQHEEASAYRAAKIAINVSHFEYKKYSSDRLLRILATGVPICLAKWYPDIENDFTDGYHLRIWRNLDELQALCNYYLDEKNNEERMLIAKQGFELAHSKFTFDNMVLNLIEIFENSKN